MLEFNFKVCNVRFIIRPFLFVHMVFPSLESESSLKSLVNPHALLLYIVLQAVYTIYDLLWETKRC